MTALERIEAVVALHAALDRTVSPSELPFDGDALPPVTCESVELPAPLPLPARGFPDVLQARRSRYNPAADALGAVELSNVLHHSLVSSPTAGGLRELTLSFVLSQPGDELGAGVYRYARGRAEVVRLGDVREHLRASLLQPEFADVFPVLLFVVANVEGPLVKYAMRHYRTMHVDAGVLVQNLYLVTEVMGLAGCAIAGFTDARVASLLNLSTTQLPVMAFALGRPS
ncbi:SagB family peptide dehydrogenase [Rhodococcus erythropolis]|uniref:SagB family peptide dehydrogenase n=1 Tax=Rhodococcus erythropolis TaxID=1833 RepID=UPI00294981F9|nr:SagB family peptide dehydrogenase [Rhodococcus erythropolis]MDV6274658.1 SagB family peptide dehydrogenase [Rhodococcus erythropolis]